MQQEQIHFAGWHDGAPQVLVGEDHEPLPLEGDLRLELSAERHCIGRVDGGTWRPCPSGAVVSQFDQCPRCGDLQAQECIFEPRCQSDPASCACTFGQVPHVVYLAFYGVLPKVGMTSRSRVATRLQEQGADAYLIVKECPDRATARITERQVAFLHGVPEYRSARETLAQMSRPVQREAIEVRAEQWRERLGAEASHAELCWVPDPPLAMPLPGKPLAVRAGGRHEGRWLGAKGRYLFYESAPRPGRLETGVGRPLHALRLRDLTGRRVTFDA